MREHFPVLALVAALGFGYAAMVFVPNRVLQVLAAVARPHVSVTDQLAPPEAITFP